MFREKIKIILLFKEQSRWIYKGSSFTHNADELSKCLPFIVAGCCNFKGDPSTPIFDVDWCFVGVNIDGLGATTVVSIVTRTVGGLNELARSELDEAMLARRSRSIETRRSKRWISKAQTFRLMMMIYRRKDFHRDFRTKLHQNSSFDLSFLAFSHNSAFGMALEWVE